MQIEEIDSTLGANWSSLQCSFSHSLDLRLLIYDDEKTPCLDPRQPPTKRVIAYFPCVEIKISHSYTRPIEENEGSAIIIVDPNQSLAGLFVSRHRLAIIDLKTEGIQWGGLIQRWERLTSDDVQVLFSLRSDGLTLEQLQRL